MITVVYASRAPVPPTDADLGRLLATARDRNAADGITGMLLYHAGSFLQQLEGEASAVDRTFGRISGDPRHDAIRLLSRRDVPRRRFDGWWMGYEQPDPEELVNRLPGYRSSIVAPLVDPELIRDAKVAETLLLLYATV